MLNCKRKKNTVYIINALKKKKKKIKLSVLRGFGNDNDDDGERWLWCMIRVDRMSWWRELWWGLMKVMIVRGNGNKHSPPSCRGWRSRHGSGRRVRGCQWGWSSPASSYWKAASILSPSQTVLQFLWKTKKIIISSSNHLLTFFTSQFFFIQPFIPHHTVSTILFQLTFFRSISSGHSLLSSSVIAIDWLISFGQSLLILSVIKPSNKTLLPWPSCHKILLSAQHI